MIEPEGEGASVRPGSAAEGPEPTQGGPRSGLRDPVRAARGLGAGTLALEALVLLLAIQPIRVLGGHLTGTTIGVIVALAVLAVLLAGLLRRPWAWHAATGLQVLLVCAGFLHWSLGALGVIFGLVWLYVLHVRRVILR
jgi:hypothetical protein